MLDATPLLRLYARYRAGQLAAQDAAAAQETGLRKLVRKAAETRFGRAHGFARVHGVAQYRERVPLRRYEDFWTAYWKDAFPRLQDCTWPGAVPFFAVTSGTTTGTTKYIPCSREMVRANVRAAAEILVHHFVNRPRSRVLGGKSFMLGGSTDLVELAPGVRSGDLSGIAAGCIPWWARARNFPPPPLALIADWEEKIERLAPLSLAEDIRSISGTPSWLLLFFDKLAALRPESEGRIARLYPALELLVHGGVNFAPYRGRFADLLAGGHAETREAYAASEGFIAVADRGGGEGMRLIVDNGLFFEFVPVEELGAPNPTRHWLAEIETGVNYALAVSSCAGLWSYVVGDTVRFVERNPPRLLITGRTSYTLSAFGEHLIDEEIEEAVSAAAEAINAAVTDYAVGPLYPAQGDERGGHLYIVEFAGAVPARSRIEAFARTLDERLCAINDDYRAHRAGGYGLRPPRIEAVPPGGFAEWMKRRGQLGGQHKVPRIVTDEALFRDLRAIAAPP